MANAIRFLCAEMIEKAQSGHPGMPLGIADVATVLFSKHLKTDVKNPKWFDRDRFVLSAGHASSLLYSLFYLMGYNDIELDDLKNFRQLGAKTAGHPEYGHLSGIDTTTGPLGQGIATSVGMALAEKKVVLCPDRFRRLALPCLKKHRKKHLKISLTNLKFWQKLKWHRFRFFQKI